MSKRKSGKQKSPVKREPAASGKPKHSGSPMDVDLLEQIVLLMSVHDLSTVDVRDGARRVILKRGADVVQHPGTAVFTTPPFAEGPSRTAQLPAATAGSSTAESAQDAADAKLVPIKSPMVGTFYAATKQGEKPFVSVGSAVSEDTDVCIIEAMKVFNVIKSETSGTIARILIQDGQPVEHGTVLFLVKP